MFSDPCNKEDDLRMVTTYDVTVILARAGATTRIKYNPLCSVDEFTTPSYSQGYCPDSYVGFKDNCYLFSWRKKSFMDANARCKANGGSLVWIENEREQRFIMHHILIHHPYLGQWWIGYKSTAKQGGEPKSYFWVAPSIATYSCWSHGEPNNKNKLCSVLVKHKKYQWANAYCNQEHAFICKLGRRPTPPPKMTTTPSGTPMPECFCPEASGLFPYHLRHRNCNLFCYCVNWRGFTQQCPEGLDFHPTRRLCVFPHQAGCSSPVLTTSTSSPPPTIPTPVTTSTTQLVTSPVIVTTANPSACQCPEPDGLFSHPHHCHLFCLCYKGAAREKACPDDLHFNARLGYCDHPDQAGCAVTVPETTVRPTGGCVCLEKHGIFPHPSQCEYFCICYNYEPILKHCPGGRHFSPYKKHCDWPQDAGCEAISTIAPVGLCASVSCPTQPVTLHRNPHNCRTYFRCSAGYLEELHCSYGLHYNHHKQQCTKDECYDDYTPPVWMRSGKQSKNPPVDTPVDLVAECKCPNSKGMFAHPHSCAHVCLCSVGSVQVLKCPEGKQFSEEKQECVDKEKTECAATKRKHDAKCPYGACNSGFDPCLLLTCPEKPMVLIPHPDECAAFYDCTDGQPKKHQCPEGLRFSDKLFACVYPEHASCGRSKQRILARSCVDLVCRAAGGRLVHPSSCHRYCRCTAAGQRAEERRCPHGYEFSSTELKCVPRRRTECTKFVDTCSAMMDLCPVGSVDTLIEHPADCNKFCRCTPTGIFEKRCPKALNFNPETKMCDWPHKVQCRDKRPAPKCPPTQPDPEILIPHPRECDKFCECRMGVPREMRCPKGSIFHPGALKCVRPSVYPCEGYPPVVCPRPDRLRLPHPTNCDAYCDCEPGYAVERSCERGRQFNPHTQHCDKHYTCPASTVPTTPTTKTSTVLTSKPLTTTRTPSVCDSVMCPPPRPIYIADNKKCTVYHACLGDESTSKLCPYNLHFNPDTITCEDPAQNGCTIDAESGCPRCPHDGYFPHPLSCSHFCHCTKGVPDKKQCPPKMHFDSKRLVCNWEKDAECDLSVHCPPEEPRFVQHPSGKCDLFCACTNDWSEERRCRPGLHFDVYTGGCTSPEEAGCLDSTTLPTSTMSGTRVYTTTPTLTSTESTTVTTETTSVFTTTPTLTSTETSPQMNTTVTNVATTTPTLTSTESTTVTTETTSVFTTTPTLTSTMETSPMTSDSTSVFTTTPTLTSTQETTPEEDLTNTTIDTTTPTRTSTEETSTETTPENLTTVDTTTPTLTSTEETTQETSPGHLPTSIDTTTPTLTSTEETTQETSPGHLPTAIDTSTPTLATTPTESQRMWMPMIPDENNRAAPKQDISLVGESSEGTLKEVDAEATKSSLDVEDHPDNDASVGPIDLSETTRLMESAEDVEDEPFLPDLEQSPEQNLDEPDKATHSPGNDEEHSAPDKEEKDDAEKEPLLPDLVVEQSQEHNVDEPDKTQFTGSDVEDIVPDKEEEEDAENEPLLPDLVVEESAESDAPDVENVPKPDDRQDVVSTEMPTAPHTVPVLSSTLPNSAQRQRFKDSENATPLPNPNNFVQQQVHRSGGPTTLPGGVPGNRRRGAVTSLPLGVGRAAGWARGRPTSTPQPRQQRNFVVAVTEKPTLLPQSGQRMGRQWSNLEQPTELPLPQPTQRTTRHWSNLVEPTQLPSPRLRQRMRKRTWTNLVLPTGLPGPNSMQESRMGSAVSSHAGQTITQTNSGASTPVTPQNQAITKASASAATPSRNQPQALGATADSPTVAKHTVTGSDDSSGKVSIEAQTSQLVTEAQTSPSTTEEKTEMSSSTSESPPPGPAGRRVKRDATSWFGKTSEKKLYTNDLKKLRNFVEQTTYKVETTTRPHQRTWSAYPASTVTSVTKFTTSTTKSTPPATSTSSTFPTTPSTPTSSSTTTEKQVKQKDGSSNKNPEISTEVGVNLKEGSSDKSTAKESVVEETDPKGSVSKETAVVDSVPDKNIATKDGVKETITNDKNTSDTRAGKLTDAQDETEDLTTIILSGMEAIQTNVNRLLEVLTSFLDVREAKEGKTNKKPQTDDGKLRKGTCNETKVMEVWRTKCKSHAEAVAMLTKDDEGWICTILTAANMCLADVSREFHCTSGQESSLREKLQDVTKPWNLKTHC